MLNNCFHRITRKGAKTERWPPRALQSFKRLTYIKRPDRQHRDTSIGGSAVLIQIQVPVATHGQGAEDANAGDIDRRHWRNARLWDYRTFSWSNCARGNMGAFGLVDKRSDVA